LSKNTVQNVDWRPDGGAVIAYDYLGVRVLGLDGSKTTVVEESADVPIAGWSPDATRIALTSSAWDEYDQLAVANADGSCPTRVLDSEAEFVAWQPVPGGPGATPIQCADASVPESYDVHLVERHSPASFDVTVKNAGNLPAATTSVDVHTSRGFAATAATTSAGTCTLGRPVRCTLGPLAAGATATITVQANVLGYSAFPVYAVAKTTGDPYPRNDSGLTGLFGICDIVGTDGADVLTGTRKRDIICGAGGNDTIDGRGGNDGISGGAGADVLRGSGGNDVLYGDVGDDRIYGGSGNDGIDPGEGRDRAFGGQGADFFQLFDQASDWVDGGRGRDEVEGRDRIDRIFRVESVH
jgi:hypothetical protein